MERYWDPLNKAAILVTLFTGVPAFLTFVGLPFVAAVALGVLSISSLVFALIRSRYLRNRIERTEKLHEIDSRLLERANALILHFDPTKDADRIELKRIINESLQTLKELAQELCRCEARMSLFTIDQDLQAISIFSSSQERDRPIVFDLKQSSVLGHVFKGSPEASTIHIDRSGDLYRLRPDPRLSYRTIAVFPIYSKPMVEGGVQTWAGFLSLDLKKRIDIPAELKAKLLKYSHLYFLILHAAGISVLQQIAQQGAPADAQKARAAEL